MTDVIELPTSFVKLAEQRAKDDAATALQASDTEVNSARLEDFVAYLPAHAYIFRPTREMWPAASVNALIPAIASGEKPITASNWLDTNHHVHQMTWAPGEPEEVKDRIIGDGGWITEPGRTVFNLYRPPVIVPKPGPVAPWLDHVHTVYPDDAAHIIKWLAHRVQRPHEKINHALVLGGAQGIGKDTLLEPVKQAVGPWNFAEVSPQHMLGRFNGFLKSVILRVSEARDLGDMDRFVFYDHMKTYTVAPPDVLRVDEKYLRETAVLNVCGVIITTNHKSDGLFLPADDRRHYVAWSNTMREQFPNEYWISLYRWYEEGGHRHVAAYLRDLHLSDFNAKAPPPKTPAFWEIVDASRAPEDAELADTLDRLGRPDVVTLDQVAGIADSDFALWLRDRKNARRIPHRFEEAGYVAVRNPTDKGGMWKIQGRRYTLYGKSAISVRDRIRAAHQLTGAR